MSLSSTSHLSTASYWHKIDVRGSGNAVGLHARDFYTHLQGLDRCNFTRHLLYKDLIKVKASSTSVNVGTTLACGFLAFPRAIFSVLRFHV